MGSHVGPHGRRWGSQSARDIHRQVGDWLAANGEATLCPIALGIPEPCLSLLLAGRLDLLAVLRAGCSDLGRNGRRPKPINILLQGAPRPRPAARFLDASLVVVTVWVSFCKDFTPKWPGVPQANLSFVSCLTLSSIAYLEFGPRCVGSNTRCMSQAAFRRASCRPCGCPSRNQPRRVRF